MEAERRAAYKTADERRDRTRGQRAAHAFAGTPVRAHGRLVAAPDRATFILRQARDEQVSTAKRHFLPWVAPARSLHYLK